MIKADKLTLLTSLPAAMLTTAIQQAGYKRDSFTRAKFMGLTNGTEFCYTATYMEDGEPHETKVFIRYDPAADRVSASY